MGVDHGSDSPYGRAHRQIATRLGPAIGRSGDERVCESCGNRRAASWRYDGGSPDENSGADALGRIRKFSTDPTYWSAECAACFQGHEAARYPDADPIEFVSIDTARDQTRRDRGRASEYPCADCERTTGRYWKYRPGDDPAELINHGLTRARGTRYSVDPDYYAPVCTRCSIRRDYQDRDANVLPTEPAATEPATTEPATTEPATGSNVDPVRRRTEVAAFDAGLIDTVSTEVAAAIAGTTPSKIWRGLLDGVADDVERRALAVWIDSTPRIPDGYTTGGITYVAPAVGRIDVGTAAERIRRAAGAVVVPAVGGVAGIRSGVVILTTGTVRTLAVVVETSTDVDGITRRATELAQTLADAAATEQENQQ